MLCERCGAIMDETDRFCRSCGKRIRAAKIPRTTHRTSPEPPVPEELVLGKKQKRSRLGLSKKRKYALFSVLAGFLALVTVLLIVFMPYLKQTFMSPAAYYLESEGRAWKALSEDAQGWISPVFTHHKKSVSGLYTMEAEGEDYEQFAQLLNELKIQATYRSDGDENADLSLTFLHEEQDFCKLLASVVSDRFSLSFPTMTDGQVVAKISQLLLDATGDSDDCLVALTGYNRRQLMEWACGYLKPILSDALEKSEQILDSAVIEGIETSTVTFRFDEELCREILYKLAKQLRSDEMLTDILYHFSQFLSTAEDFLNDLAAEFNLTQEDLIAIPMIGHLVAVLPDANPAEDGALRALVSSRPSEEDVTLFLENTSDRVRELADSLKLKDDLSLTAYYQRTELIGRSLRLGTKTLFEAFRYQRDDETVFTVQWEKEKEIYMLSHVDSSTNTHSEHRLSLTTFSAEAQTGENAEKKVLFDLVIDAAINGEAGGVPTFLGEMRFTLGDTTYTIDNDKRDDNLTDFSFEVRKENGSKLKIRSQLTYSTSVKSAEITAAKSSDFGKPAFKQLVLELQKRLADDEALFNELFGEGALARFHAEEELRKQEEALNQNPAQPDNMQGESGDFSNSNGEADLTSAQ